MRLPFSVDSEEHSPGHRRVASIGIALLVGFVLAAAGLGGVTPRVRLFQASYLVGFLGYAVLMVALWRGRLPGRWRLWLILCVVIRVALIHATPSDDVYRYLWEGRIQTAGFNPYNASPDDRELAVFRDAHWAQINHPDYPAIYPPLAQLEFRLAAWISPRTLILKILHAGWDALALVIIAAWLRAIGRDERWAIVYGLCPLTITAFAIEGHVDSLMVVSLAGAGLAATRRRDYLCGLLLGSVILAKIVGVVMLPWLIRRNWRSALLCGAVVLAGYSLYLDVAAAPFDSLIRFATEQELLGLGYTILTTAFDGRTARVIGAVVVVAVAIRQAWTGASFGACGGAAFGALILMSPIVHIWYLTWVLVFMPFSPRGSWLVLAASMVLYFEAAALQASGEEWRMPTWVLAVIYIPFVVACVAAVSYGRRLGRRAG